MPLFDDFLTWMQRNFSGSKPASAANTITQAALPPPDGLSPAARMAAGMTGSRPLNPGETPTPLPPAPDATARRNSNPFTPEWAQKTGLGMIAAGEPRAIPTAPVNTPVHAPEPNAPGLVQSVFPTSPAPADFSPQKRPWLQNPWLQGILGGSGR